MHGIISLPDATSYDKLFYFCYTFFQKLNNFMLAFFFYLLAICLLETLKLKLHNAALHQGLHSLLWLEQPVEFKDRNTW